MLKKIFVWFKKKRNPKSNSPETMRALLKMLAMTEAHEITCDEVFLVLAEFAEMTQRGENIEELMPLVQKHLDMCPDCREEYEVLMRVLDSE